MTHQIRATSGPNTHRSEDAIPHKRRWYNRQKQRCYHATTSRSLVNTSLTQKISLTHMEKADGGTKGGDERYRLTDNLATAVVAPKGEDQRFGLKDKLATADRAKKGGDQRDNMTDKLSTADTTKKKEDQNESMTDKLSTADRAKKGEDQRERLMGKWATADMAPRGGDQRDGLTGKFAIIDRAKKEGDQMDSLTDKLSTTDRITKGEDQREKLTDCWIDKLATAEKDFEGGGKRDSLTDNLESIDRATKGEDRCDSLMDKLSKAHKEPGGEGKRNRIMDGAATAGRPTKIREKRENLTDKLVPADGNAKTGGKRDGLTVKLATVNGATEGGCEPDKLTDKLAGMSLGCWKYLHPKQNEVYSFTFKRPNGTIDCVPWHVGAKEDAIIWSNHYSRFVGNTNNMLIPNSGTRNHSFLQICNCGRYPTSPVLPFLGGHNIFHPVWSHFWGNGHHPSMMPINWGTGYPQPAGLSSWAYPFAQFELPFLHPMKSFWFHETDFEHARNIISNGINLELGRYKRQFSNGFGFYLSDNFEHARWWASRDNASRPTVIAFKLSFSFNDYDGLDLAQNEHDWQDIVKFCLNNHHICPFNINPVLYHRYRTCQYVHGPVVKNRPDFTNIENWRPIGFRGPCRQMCVRDTNLAKAICRVEHIDSVMTFTTQLR